VAPLVPELVTVTLFLYFLQDGLSPELELIRPYGCAVRQRFSNNCLIAELSVPPLEEVHYKVQNVTQAHTWGAPEKIPERYYWRDPRKIESSRVTDQSWCLDVVLENFNKYYSSTGTVSESCHFYRCATQAALETENLDLFKALVAQMFKLLGQYRDRYYPRAIHLSFNELVNNFTQKGVQQPSILLKAFLVCDVCTHASPIDNIFPSLELIKASLPAMAANPELIGLAQKYCCSSKDRRIDGFFLLVAARAHPHEVESLRFAKMFQETSGGTFTAAELDYWKADPWDKPLPHLLCSSLKMANTIDCIKAVRPVLLTEGLGAYLTVLSGMSVQDYFAEWRWCLSEPFIPTKIPFTLVSKFPQHHLTTTVQDQIDETIKLLDDTACEGWVKHFIQEVARYFSTQSLTLINKIYKAFKVLKSPKWVPFFHAALPQNDEHLMTRLAAICQYEKSTNEREILISGLEKPAILGILNQLLLETTLRLYHQALVTKGYTKYKNGLEAYAVVWEKLIKPIQDAHPITLSKSNAVLKAIRPPNDDQPPSDLFFCLASDEMVNHFTEARNLGAAPARMKVLAADAKQLSDCIETGALLASVQDIVSDKLLAPRLSLLCREFKPASINEWVLRKTTNLEKWDRLLVSIDVMKDRDQFASLAKEFQVKYQKEYQALGNKPIRDWAPPDCADQLDQISQRLLKAQDSRFFQSVWQDPKLGAKIHPTALKDLVENWVIYVEAYLAEWQSLITRVAASKVSISVIEPLFRDREKVDMVRILKLPEQEVRHELEQISKRVKQSIKDTIEQEIETANSVLKLGLESQVIFAKLSVCIEAIDSKNDIFALRDLCSKLDIMVPDTLSAFCPLFIEGANPLCLEVIDQYHSVVQTLPKLPEIFKNYPVLFNEVMYKKDLMTTLKKFPNPSVLDQKIDHRQGEELREETHANLHALRLVGKSIMSHPLFPRLREHDKNITPTQLVNFFSETGGAFVALVSLKGSPEPFEDSLQSQTEERLTIAIVKNLLVNGGAFFIQVKDGQTSVYAQQQYQSKKEYERVIITPEELEALPSQLLLHSGVINKDSNWDVDAPLPPDISKVEDRAPHVFRFNMLFDAVFNLSRITQKLCESGHPSYQENLLPIPCKVRYTTLLRELESRQEELGRWTTAFFKFRSEEPMLSFFSRSQLVSCLAALKKADESVLFAILQSIGCDPAKMHQSLAATIAPAKEQQKCAELFRVLSESIRKFFDVDKLLNPGVPNLKQVGHPFGIDTHVKLVKLEDPSIEEVICGAHLAIHQRAPTSLEVLFCTPTTTDIDIFDFLDRWALFREVYLKVPVTFWLVGIESLSYQAQTSFVQKLVNASSRLPLTSPKLFLVTNMQDSYIATVMSHQTIDISTAFCATLKELLYPLAAAEDNVFVAHSKTCGEGKTESVIKRLVCGKFDTTGAPVYHTQVSLDSTPMEVHLKRLAKDRPITKDQGCVLHFNIGHLGDPQEISRFLFQYLLIGSWRDQFGATHPRHQKDIIVIELCNTGLDDERERIGICRYFKEFKLDTGISHTMVEAVPSNFSNLFYSFKINHDLRLGTKMLIKLFYAMTSGETTLGDHGEIPIVDLVEADELMNMVASIAADNFCPNRHLMQRVDPPPDTPCSACKTLVNPGCGVFCFLCNHALCPRCMQQNAIPAKAELIYLRRFFRFAATQLNNFYFSFQGQWEFPDPCLQKMAYHFSRMIIKCALSLAKPAVAPFDPKNPLDDVRRCADMEKFEKWRTLPLFISTVTKYFTFSTSAFSPLKFVKENEPPGDREFHDWLDAHQAAIRPIDRSRLHSLCAELTEKAFSLDQRDPPLRSLLDVLGCFRGATPVLNTLESLNDLKLPGTMSIQDAKAKVDSLDRAIAFLARNGVNLSPKATVTGFKSECQTFLNKIFGNDPEKPNYTLTADNILRIIAVQLRLLSKVPVCIMGETGCGKTESIYFLSKISGMDFKVINVQEGMTEAHFYEHMQPIIKEAQESPQKEIVVLLDEVNTSAALWTAKDMLTDRLCFGVRIPSNIVFVVILNPWKIRTDVQAQAIDNMDAGGLDILKYQQSSGSTVSTRAKKVVPHQKLVYQVHQIPESLYSLVWDWGSSSTTETPLEEIRPTIERKLLLSDMTKVSDEHLMASSMVDWLIRKLDRVQELGADFKASGDSVGEGTWRKFRTILVELLIVSQSHIRDVVYLKEISAVSLRDIRKACGLIWLVFNEFMCRRALLQTDLLKQPFPYFKFLTIAVQTALVNTYCLRLDTIRRHNYLVRIHVAWANVRARFSDIHPALLPAPQANPASYQTSEIYQAFDELATYIAQDLLIDEGIAVNQALKENNFGVLCAVLTKSTLFIVGRPGSTKSRTLELLCNASEYCGPNTFLGQFGVIQKHVVQCSPYTTAHHIHQNARKAVLAHQAAQQVQGTRERINVIVLEEVGATIGSAHNPLMSLHSMIDHGIYLPPKKRDPNQNLVESIEEDMETEGKHIRLPILGISNYRLDASKMGRGLVIYRGNPPIGDLQKTAEAILKVKDTLADRDWIPNFSQAFSENILLNKKAAWYYGMRDFYSTTSSMRILAAPLPYGANPLKRAGASQITSHCAMWSVFLNLRGFPKAAQEQVLVDSMIESFGFPPHTDAKWVWTFGGEETRLCDCCCRMQMYRLALGWQVDHPQETITDQVLQKLFRAHAGELRFPAHCQYFNETKFVPAPEIISYSLREHTSRHVMIFTKANAALFLLFSMKLVNRDECTVIFQSTASKDSATTTSELVQQMMRIKGCMREGRTLILVKSRHLYESLLDALNVHYTKDRTSDEDNLHRTMLSMGGVTQSVFVQPTFRCIVLEDQDELKSSVLPPMINRFSKVVLTYSSALTPQQRAIRNGLVAQYRIQVDNQELNLLQFLIPGLSDESIDSAVCAFGDKAIRHLCFCFSRKNLRRSAYQLVEGLNTEAAEKVVARWQRHWETYQCDLGLASAASLLFTPTEEVTVDEKAEEKATEQKLPQHLMIITEQLDFDPASVTELVQYIFAEAQEEGEAACEEEDAQEEEGNEPEEEEEDVVEVSSTFHFLNQSTTQDIQVALQNLRKTLTSPKKKACAIFGLDTTSTSQSVSLDSFMFAVSTEKFAPEHHVVLIVVVSDFIGTPTKANKFSIVFDSNWGQIFADELVPHQLLPEQEGSLLSDLEKSRPLHECLTHEFMTALVLEKDTLTTLCQSLSSSPTEVSKTRDIIEKLMKSKNVIRERILDLVIDYTQKADKNAGIPFPLWSRLALQKSRFSSDSLCATYLDFLRGYLVRVLGHIFCFVTQFDSLELALDEDETSHVVAQILESQAILPSCDALSCLNGFSNIKKTDVESDRGYFRFPKDSVISYPLSPFLIKHIFNLGADTNHIEGFCQAVQLDRVNGVRLASYIIDAVCIGRGFPVERVGLLNAVINVFHSGSLKSIAAFHTLVAQHSEWFKDTLSFCMQPFAKDILDAFLANATNASDIVKLSSVGGVVPLSRVDILLSVTNNDPNVDWRIIRAMAMIDAQPGQDQAKQTENRALLSQLSVTFKESQAKGVLALFQDTPSSFIKYFLFELFGPNDNMGSDEIQAILVALAKTDNFQTTVETDQSLRCGVGFVLKKAFGMLYHGQPDENLRTSVSNFLTTSASVYALCSHCALEYLLQGDVGVDEETLENCGKQGPLAYFLKMVLSVALIMNLSDTTEADRDDYQELRGLLQAILATPEDAREATLFLIRQLSSGGTVELDKAIKSARSTVFPKVIRGCAALDDLAQVSQTVSAIACFPEFTRAVTCLQTFSASKKQEDLDKFNALDNQGTRGAIAAFCIDAGTVPIENFTTDVFPLLGVPNTAHMINTLLNAPDAFKDSSKELRQLVLHLFMLIENRNEVLRHYFNIALQSLDNDGRLAPFFADIDKRIYPRCPRCQEAFIDWKGCWSLYCTDKCRAGFCGVCFQDCGTDAHPHLLAQHGGYFHGDHENFRASFTQYAIKDIRGLLGRVPPDLKPLIEEYLIAKLADFRVFPLRSAAILQDPNNPNPARPDTPAVANDFSKILSIAGFLHQAMVGKHPDSKKPIRDLLQEFLTPISNIRSVLFPNAQNDSATYNWVHAMLDEIGEPLPGGAHRDTVQERICQIVGQFPDPLQLLAKFDQKCQPNSTGIVKELQLTFEQLQKQAFNAATQRQLLFLSRSVYNFNAQFWSHIKSNFDTYQVLALLGDRRSSMDVKAGTTQRTQRILQFLAKVQEATRKLKYSKASAEEEGSFLRLLGEAGALPDVAPKDPALQIQFPSYKQFEEDFVTALKLVHRWECNTDIQQHYGHMVAGIAPDTKLACFLPSRDGLGVLAMALYSGKAADDKDGQWMGLPNVQNILYERTHDQAADRLKPISPFNLTERDVVSVDYIELLDAIGSLFLVPNYHPCLSKDLPLVEEFCKYGRPRLASFPLISAGLSQFDYELEGLGSKFKNLQTSLGKTNRSLSCLPSLFANAVQSLIATVPAAVDQIFAFCSAILVQEGGEDHVVSVNEISKLKIVVPLTTEQERGKQTLLELPDAVNSFCVEHIPALMSYCWSRKPYLHASFDEPLQNDDEAREIVATLTKIAFEQDGKTKSKFHNQIPDLLASLRTLGLAQLTTEIGVNFCSTPVWMLLDLVDVPFLAKEDLFDPWSDQCVPFTSEVRYFGHILRAAEAVLGKEEFSSKEEAPVIPIAALRPFLKPQPVEENPKVNEKPVKALLKQKPEENVKPAKQQKAKKQTEDVVIQWNSGGDLEF